MNRKLILYCFCFLKAVILVKSAEGSYFMERNQSRIQYVTLLAIMILAILPATWSQSARSVINSNRHGVAIEGYDAVAYHLLGQAVKGEPTISFQWMEATWHFASSSHRDLFVQDPNRYAPRFGGYCSWAVSRGTTASIDPEAWHIEDGALYLNLNPRIHRNFLADLQENIRKAEANWPAIRERLAK